MQNAELCMNMYIFIYIYMISNQLCAFFFKHLSNYHLREGGRRCINADIQVRVSSCLTMKFELSPVLESWLVQFGIPKNIYPYIMFFCDECGNLE